jgi:glycosyltransferase involved in cell wall biosynthesis
MKSVLMVQPSLQPPGGGNAVAAWMIQALCEVHSVSVLTWAEVDFEAVDRHFGTDLKDRRIVRLRPPRALRAAVDALSRGADLLKSSLLLRHAKRRARAYGAVMTANNEADLGRRGLQYVHYPRYLRPRPRVDLKWFHVPPLLAAYYRLCDALADFSFERMRANLTCVNSAWTGRLFERLHGVRPLVLHPPAAQSGSRLPWEARQDGFLCLGRLAPEKEIERVIGILDRVRADFPRIRLHVVGGHGPAHYEQRIAELVRGRAGWASLELDAPRRALDALLGTCRYGLHGMRDEHFGMAAAEMVAAGMIVFLPDGGGQVEIVGGDRSFLFASDDEAVAMISATLASADEQRRRLAALAGAREQRAPGRFMERVRALFEEHGLWDPGPAG